MKQQFLATFDEEHERTMRVLNAYPEDKADLRPHPKAKTALELAWVFAMECGLGTRIWHDEFKDGFKPGATPPPPPDKWKDVLAAIEKATKDFRALAADASDETLRGKVHFLVAPKTMGEMSRMDLLWFLLHDQIHHRGQLSVYLRMADGKVPSIYGPSGDEPWI